MKTTTGVLLAAIGLACGARVDAQVEQGGLSLRLIPRAGIIAPDTYFYEQYTNFSGDGPVEWTNASLGRALVLGLGCEVGRSGGPLMVRAEVLRSFNGWLSAAHSTIVPRQVFEPPRVQTTWMDVRTAVTTVGLQIVLPTRLSVLRGQPYFLAGAGGKRYDFDTPDLSDNPGAILPSDGTTWAFDLGAGITVPFAGFDIDLQGRDVLNRYWGKTEHDLLFTGGLAWRIR